MHKGRNLHITQTSIARFGRRLSAAHRGALLPLPAFLLACSPLPMEDVASVPPARKVQIYILQSEKTTLEGLELLFFQADSLERLDAYQHFGTVTGNRVEGTSSSAARSLVVLANCPGDAYDWSDIQTSNSLKERVFHLEEERPGAPMMTGRAVLEPGSSRSCQVTLRPALARITLRSVGCDFSGRSYAGTRLLNVRAYLTNASRECRPLDPEDHPVSWLNAGRLDELETASLAHPELVLADVSPSLGGRIFPALDFYCYPNPSDGTGFGQPVTRLVLEGELQGTTYYYPIDLPGLEANVQYRMDVTLTRAGTTDPDTPAVAGSIVLESRVLDWDERDWDPVHYR